MSRVALVHDYLLTMRGAERTFSAIADGWPDATVFTSVYDPAVTEDHFSEHQIVASFVQRLGVGQAGFRKYLPLYPLAVERLPVQSADLIISSSSAFAHGVRPANEATHVCYCHSPFRYVWHESELALSEVSAAIRPLLRRVLKRIRQWDLDASKRVTHYVANSRITQERIAEFYDRDSVIISPPVAIERFGPPRPAEDWFLYVGEIVAHKRVDSVLKACRSQGVRVKVVGDGPERGRLESSYGNSADFLGRVSDADLESLYARCRALIAPNVEEFGIAIVEAMASGRPVLAVDAGGARETVEKGLSGVLVPNGDATNIAKAIATTDFDAFHPGSIRRHAMKFSAERFRSEIVEYVSGLAQCADDAGSGRQQKWT